MTIDLDDIESRINDGIYGDDRMSDTARDDAFSALAEILAEVERLRLERAAERAAVVAWLRRPGDHEDEVLTLRWAREIESGEHRREEE